MGARKKVVFACVAVAALLALAEAGLRLAGCPVGPRLREVDWTLRECARFFPCVREGGAGGQHARVYSFPAGPTDRGMTFCARKPRGTLRLFCLGDSAAYGRPYFPQAAFSAWLARDLRIALPGRPIEVINAAQPGMDSFGVRLVAGEALQFQPDLIIVYCGNNEFLPHNLARARAALASPVAYRVRCALDRTALYGLFKDALFRAGGHPMLAQEA
ncbi:MAG: SGNH/GDSL hydrolase family protein, partial [Planctomycetes bacterium]|nr:SGNH/GDSL hydrolase family protein [Planctomycetota bacterium]